MEIGWEHELDDDDVLSTSCPDCLASPHTACQAKTSPYRTLAAPHMLRVVKARRNYHLDAKIRGGRHG